MTKLNNSVAVVTGAGSGIGQALAVALGQYGCQVAISDINHETLDNTVALLEQQGTDFHSAYLDVSQRDDVFDYATKVQDHFGKVNVVINNAGVALASGSFNNTTLEEFEWLMGINFSGVVYGTKAFLPILKDADWGHIVNISSVFGIIGVAEQSAYNSSKFAVRGLTEAIRNEFEILKSSVSATSVHPGGIKTNIARNSKAGDLLNKEQIADLEETKDLFDTVARTTPESAAEQIIAGILRNKRRVLIGADAKLLDLVQRISPSGYHHVYRWLMRKTVGREQVVKD